MKQLKNEILSRTKFYLDGSSVDELNIDFVTVCQNL